MVIKINIMKIKINDKCSSNYCEIKINHKMVKNREPETIYNKRYKK